MTFRKAYPLTSSYSGTINTDAEKSRVNFIHTRNLIQLLKPEGPADSRLCGPEFEQATQNLRTFWCGTLQFAGIANAKLFTLLRNTPLFRLNTNSRSVRVRNSPVTTQYSARAALVFSIISVVCGGATVVVVDDAPDVSAVGVLPRSVVVVCCVVVVVASVVVGFGVVAAVVVVVVVVVVAASVVVEMVVLSSVATGTEVCGGAG